MFSRLPLESPSTEREVLARVSHELRTPLNAILGFAQLLADDSLSDSQRESVEQITVGARQMLAITGRLLESATARVDSVAPVELRGLVDAAVTLCRPLAAEQRLELHVDPIDEACWALADGPALTQVLLNLLSNSVKYNRPGGLITVRVRADAAHAQLEVSDTGFGIDPTRLGKLFEAFERLDAPQRGIEGTGLGLTLSKTLVEAMGGAIEVRSQPGAGSTFSVTLRSAPAPQRVTARGKPRPVARVAPVH